ncbi:MAG: KEOPS complex subunit Pcc1 [Nitrososphaerota archaeon]|nr:KEOPS complex subunit Pcc1 [Candidatus Bathyarchaeota archaeon]MDW8023223.1 KEOPS complex subunit Pcc1 [Nitrososphaerota archaeon]
MEAEILIYYDDAETAAAIADAVSPDNLKTLRGLLIKTSRKENEVSTFIKCGKGLATFIATIDDLLFSVSIAEKTLKVVKKTL